MADEKAGGVGIAAYEPTQWADGAAGKTPISAANLNKIEAGIAQASALQGAGMYICKAGEDPSTVEVPYQPTWVYDPATKVMTYVAEDGARSNPLASAADLAAVRDSVSQAFVPRGVNPDIQGIDYTSTAPGCYWVNDGETTGTYPAGVIYGILAVFKVDSNVLQLMANETSLWWRMNVNNLWSAWRQV